VAHNDRHPFLLGWEAAKANAGPALLIQGLMLLLLLGYDFSPAVARSLDDFASYEARHGYTFVVVAAVLAGAVIPEIFLVLFFQRGRITKRNLRNLCFTIPIWAIDG
jgi:hypothetical protein